MIVGEPSDEVIEDLPVALTWGFVAMMFVLVIAGVTLTGDL